MVRTLAFVSLLKSVDDVRMYEKFARTLASRQDLAIHILAAERDFSQPSEANIWFHPWYSGENSLWKRIGAPFKLYKKMIAVNPAITIVSSPDLLILTVLYKILYGTKLYYDIRENYALNLWYSTFWPGGLRHLLAIGVRALERVLHPFLDGYFLAEKVYAKQLSYTEKKALVVENLYQGPLLAPKELPYRLENGQFVWDRPLRIVMTGTLSTGYGLGLAQELKQQLDLVLANNYQLVFAGKSGLVITNRLSTTKTASPKGIRHDQVLLAISQADLAIAPYPANPAFEGKNPTKLHEYAALGIPVWVNHANNWQLGKLANWEGFRLFSFSNTNFERLSNLLTTHAKPPFAKPYISLFSATYHADLLRHLGLSQTLKDPFANLTNESRLGPR